jgi:hypothetical protein
MMQILIGVAILIDIVAIGVLFIAMMEPGFAETLASMLYSRATAVRMGRQIYRESRKMVLKLEDPKSPEALD